uniref:TNF superfamily member 8 n=1 Tax=Varanus komodoensis TaxID=61221 RepID=A0A8D2LNN3_VARKO
MSFQLEQKPFLPVNPPEVARDMTEESVSRQIGAPVHTYLYFIIASLTICLLATLGTILVLVLQRNFSCIPCASRQTVSSDLLCIPKAVPSILDWEVLKVNQSQLKWMRDSILYNMKYNDGNLVIQIPGMYFVYCHLYFYVAQCESDEMDVKVKLLHGKKILKESVVTLCSSQQKSGGLTHDRFLGLLVHLEKGDQISVEIDPFNHLETNIFPKNNVLGAFRYDGEDWGCSFLKAVNG